MPAWSDHFLELIMPEIQSLIAKAGADSIVLSVWSDCGGMGMEMISMRDIQDSMRRMTGFEVTLKLHCFCDKEEACRTLLMRTTSPCTWRRTFSPGTSLMARTSVKPMAKIMHSLSRRTCTCVVFLVDLGR